MFAAPTAATDPRVFPGDLPTAGSTALHPMRCTCTGILCTIQLTAVNTKLPSCERLRVAQALGRGVAPALLAESASRLRAQEV